MIGRFLETLVERRLALRRIMYGVLALLLVLDFLIPPAYERFPWEGISGFGAFFGLVACALIIALAKGLGYGLLYRRENYYND